MKVLILGTSQAACLRHAQNADPKLAARIGELSYAVTPGSTGPYFSIRPDGGLQVEEPPKPQGRPFFLPPTAEQARIDDFDAIVISTLGATAAVTNYRAHRSHPGLLHRFGPRANRYTDWLMSESLAEATIAGELEAQHGARLLRELATRTRARLVVQPYPLPSARAADSPEWTAAMLYDDARGAHRFYSDARLSALRKLCASVGATLLDYPDPAWAADGFTPPEYVSDDLVHTNAAYGALVLAQVADAVQAS